MVSAIAMSTVSLVIMLTKQPEIIEINGSRYEAPRDFSMANTFRAVGIGLGVAAIIVHVMEPKKPKRAPVAGVYPIVSPGGVAVAYRF